MQPSLSEVGWLLSGVLALCTTALGAAMTFAFVTWPKLAREDQEARRQDRDQFVKALNEAVTRLTDANANEATENRERHYEVVKLLGGITDTQARIAETLARLSPPSKYTGHNPFPGYPERDG